MARITKNKSIIIVSLVSLALLSATASAYTFTLDFPQELVDFIMYLEMLLPTQTWTVGGLDVTGDLNVTGTLTAGSFTFNSSVVDDLIINNNLTVGGNVSIGDSILVSGGATFSGPTPTTETLGYDNIRFGIYSHTPRIIFDDGINTSEIDYVGNNMRFIIQINATGTIHRAIMRVHQEGVRIGENLHRADLLVEGHIKSTEAISSHTGTISVSADDTDVSKINTLFVSTTGGNVVIDGFTGGVLGQVLYLTRTDAANDLTLKHKTGAGDQLIYMHEAADETVNTFCGFTLICNGTDWYDVSHAKHV